VAIFSCKKFSPKTLSLSTIHLLGMDRWDDNHASNSTIT